MLFFCCFLVTCVCVQWWEHSVVLPRVPISGSPAKKMLQTHTPTGRGLSPRLGQQPSQRKGARPKCVCNVLIFIYLLKSAVWEKLVPYIVFCIMVRGKSNVRCHWASISDLSFVLESICVSCPCWFFEICW